MSSILFFGILITILYKIRLKKKILQEEILSFQDAAVCYALNTIKFDFVFFI